MQPAVVVAATYFYIVVVREHFAGVIGIFSKFVMILLQVPGKLSLNKNVGRVA